MSNLQPDSQRTRIRLQAYLLGFQECTGWVASSTLQDRAQRCVKRILRPQEERWATGLTLYYYRKGWRDHQHGKPCQPFSPKESEEA